MSSSSAKPARDYVIRDTSSMVVFGLAVAVLIALFALVFPDFQFIGFLLPLALLFVWVLWIVLLRPKIQYNPSRAIVVNILRTFDIPWPRVKSVEQRLNIVFYLDDGRSIIAAGASASRGPGVVVGGITGQIERRDEKFNHNVDTLEANRAVAAPNNDPVSSRWNVIPLGIGAVLILAVAIDLLVSLT